MLARPHAHDAHDAHDAYRAIRQAALWPAAVWLALALVAACGSSTGPEGITPASYSLTAYDGGGLPAILSPALGLCGGQLVSAQLSTSGTGTGLFARAISAPCSAGNPVQTSELRGDVTATPGGFILHLDGYADTVTVSGPTATLRHRGGTSPALEVHTYTLTRD